MSHRITRWTLAAVAGAAALTLAACGSEQESSSAESAPSASAPVGAGPSGSAPVVAGPRPASPTRSVSDTVAASREVCGTTPGPDGALRVIILEGSTSCTDAKALAEAYGPKIATGAPQTVDGWDCEPSSQAGFLSTCTKDGATVGFAP
ncbi:hypothetical protein [Gordonia desulfuricans]|nr:hypothetical protein [Gordonia desulfuricans]